MDDRVLLRVPKAALLEGRLRVPGSNTEPYALKAWEAPRNQYDIRWEVRRLLPFAGYACTSHRTQPCNRLRSMAALFKDLAASFQWELADMMGCSERQLRANGALDKVFECDIEQETWMTTPMVLACLLEWSVFFRRGQGKRHAAAALLEFMSRTLEGVEIDTFPFETFFNTEKASCRLGCDRPGDAEALCVCMTRLLTQLKLENFSGEPPEKFCQQVVRIWEFRARCSVVDRVLPQVLLRAGDLIDREFQQWGNFDLRKSKVAVLRGPGGRPRRLDPHLKQLVVQGALLSGTAKTCREVVVSNGLGDGRTAAKWRDQELSGLLAACRLSFRVPPPTLSLTMDAASVGKPAREMFCIAMDALPQHRCVMLPPQEPSYLAIRQCQSWVWIYQTLSDFSLGAHLETRYIRHFLCRDQTLSEFSLSLSDSVRPPPPLRAHLGV